MLGNGPTCIELRDLVLINSQKCFCVSWDSDAVPVARLEAPFMFLRETLRFSGKPNRNFPGKMNGKETGGSRLPNLIQNAIHKSHR